jgi:hypothetical protein
MRAKPLLPPSNALNINFVKKYLKFTQKNIIKFSIYFTREREREGGGKESARARARSTCRTLARQRVSRATSTALFSGPSWCPRIRQRQCLHLASGSDDPPANITSSICTSRPRASPYTASPGPCFAKRTPLISAADATQHWQ